MPKKYSVYLNVTATTVIEVEITDEELEEIDNDLENNDEILYDKAIKAFDDKTAQGDFADLVINEVEGDDYEEA